MLIVAFQMLSAVESQWLDFLVYDRAAQRYEDSTELARFVSQFAAIAYGTDILFLLLLAGFLLRRYGLRYGLTANSLGVLTVVAAIIVATTIQGAGATLVFVLVVAARVVDLTFSDGTSRTSLSAAYQAVPNSVRAVVQATVEGLAVPLAIGISGVVLLLVDAAGYTDSLLLPVLTALVVIAWVVVADDPVPRVRREPARKPARAHARHHDADRRGREQPDRDRPPRRESPTSATCGSGSTSSPSPSTRRSTRGSSSSPSTTASTSAPMPSSACATWLRTSRRRPPGRVSMTPPRRCGRRACECWVRPAIRQTSRRSWPGRAMPSQEVRVAVAFSLTRLGEHDSAATVAADIARLAVGEMAHDRVLAALMLHECDPEARIDRARARRCSSVDADHDVVCAALAALRWPEDAALLPAVVGHLADRSTVRGRRRVARTSRRGGDGRGRRRPVVRRARSAGAGAVRAGARATSADRPRSRCSAITSSTETPTSGSR